MGQKVYMSSVLANTARQFFKEPLPGESPASVSESASSSRCGCPVTQMGWSISHCSHWMDAELCHRRILVCTSQMVNEVGHFDRLSF